jgi:glycosyltransferase involved in cell wall biosynthesis
MTELPLVSVICLCYNHERFVAETLNSVWTQTYPGLEVIIVDDASTDDSVKVIRQFLETHPVSFPVKTLFLEENIGNCAAFNRAWRMSEGDFVIDLATDDVLLPDRVSRQLSQFASLPPDYGVVFSEARYIDEAGRPMYDHFAERYRHIRPVPQGAIFPEVLARYFIPSPTMTVRREVFDRLGGYDENLAYEDFDFWVRSSRHFRYAYLDECTTLIRKSRTSMSQGWYKVGDRQLHATYLVCEKVRILTQTPREKQALLSRVKFEVRQAVFSGNFEEATHFFRILREEAGIHGIYRLLRLLHVLRVNLSWLRQLYLHIRY